MSVSTTSGWCSSTAASSESRSEHDATIDYNAMTYPQPAPGAQPGWRFPDGTVMVKTFSLDLEPGNPKSRRRLETRLLVRNARGVYGVTYRWDDTQTNAAGKFYRVQVLEP